MSGFAEAVWTAIGLAIGTYINWLIVAKPLRVYTEKTGSFTLPDFFSARFGDKKGILTAAAALFIVVFFIPYTASGFSAIGKLFNSLFGIDYVTVMIIGAIVKLAKNMNMEVVQEGVENKAMLDRVVGMGITVIQGYHYAKAIPLEEFKIFIKSNTSIRYKAIVK